MSRLVLCISGKRFMGKNTLARLLVAAARERGITLHTYAFAGESRRLFAARPQFTVDALAADPLVFVREVMRRIHVADGFPLITDLRLRLELDHLRKVAQPYVLRVTRADANRAASGWTYDATKDTHYTETELDDPRLWNEEIVNDGTEHELARRADEVITRVLI